ncbi:Putative serine protease F56F10.1 [Toxocara canis]|uniref:Putative serine protease F56F10.1 n=1 Tax=Toxocara canis TaxID=6265 RepID=A0A0B2V7Q3_TOXCA|nr:Putative serine protease F56F10.1 [Toxocara canis]
MTAVSDLYRWYGNAPEAPKETMLAVETFYVTQPIDHKNPSLGTWQQRVQYNPTFYRNESLIFLMIGGESPAAEKWVANPNITYLIWAKKYGAAVFQLEHRFFGNSRPYNDMKTSSLKYCTVDQALEDLASFIRQMNQKYGYVNPKWVTFGGSYPGALNAWFRARYPDLTVGAVASSAPLTFLLDYYAYAMVMENVLRETDTNCRDKVGNSITVILSKALTEAGRKELSEKLKLKPAFNETTLVVRDLQNMMAYLFGAFQGIVQYTYDGKNSITMGGFNVRNMCTAITNAPTSDPVLQMRAIIDWIYTFYPSDNGTLANSYSGLIDILKNTTFDDENGNENAALRGWMWLCCNELGVLQTTDQGRNIFGNMLPLNYYVDMCTDIFGESVNIVSIRDNNLAFRSKYGDAKYYKAKNIVLPNGSFDPWYPLGTYISYPELHQKAFLISGTAHCADMYPAWEGEPEALAPARAEIEKELEYFITGTMATVALTLLLLVLLALSTDAYIHLRHPNLPHFLMGRPPGGFLESGYHNAVGRSASVKLAFPEVQEFYITQVLDHLNSSDARTWQQRVQYNPQFYNNSNIAFVMIGGESMIAEKWLGNVNVSMMKMAKKFGAAAFHLEHRFFGQSRPFPTMTTEALAYCTTEQALADLAEFIRQMNIKYNFKNARWVTFGGSYPEYSMVVEQVFNETDPVCHDQVRDAIAHIQKIMLTTAGRQQLNQAFNLQPPFDDSNITPLSLQNFMSNLYGMFQGVVQYTYDGRDQFTMGDLNVRKLCDAVTKMPANKPLQQIRAVMDFLNTFYPHTGSCVGNVSTCTFANSYDEIIKVYGNVTYDESTDIAAWRGWMWLCCNEIGFLQTTDGGKNIFGEMVPLNFYVDMCTDLFGPTVKIDQIASRNDIAQEYYGGADHYKATNVILPNGSLDPWHALGTYIEDKPTHKIPLLINGTAHCADMYPAYPNEPKALEAARQTIEDEVAYYIQQSDLFRNSQFH